MPRRHRLEQLQQFGARQLGGRELGQALGSPVTVGAAGPAAGPAELPTTHTEACRCLSALRVLGHTGHGGATDDLGFVGVLLGERADLGGYVRATLGAVLDYDARVLLFADVYQVHHEMHRDEGSPCPPRA